MPKQKLPNEAICRIMKIPKKWTRFDDFICTALMLFVCVGKLALAFASVAAMAYMAWSVIHG